MMKNLRLLRSRYSLSRVDNKILIRGKYFTYSPLGLKKLDGELYIPIKDVIDVGILKTKSNKARTIVIISGLVTILFDKIFGKKIFDILGIEEFDTVTVILIGIWVLIAFYYLINRRTLIEIATEKNRYCIQEGNITLEELINLIR